MTTTTAADTSEVPQFRPAAGTGAPTAAVRAIDCARSTAAATPRCGPWTG